MANLPEHLERLVSEMEAHAIPSKGENMAKYLKNHFVCYGIKSPVRNEIQRKWFGTLKGQNIDPWDVVYNLWYLDQREYQYVAIDYMKKWPKRLLQKDDYKKLEELITTKSWWDSVDSIASNTVGSYFQAYPEMIDPVITRWRNSDNMWLNRTCLIYQLKYRDAVDFELLKGLILQYMPNKEFFIQKAIGWSLRQYSKYNPDAVREFIADLELSTVAKREAVKYL